MDQLQIFQYQGSNVDFEVINGQVYASATAMCRPFGKRPNDWYNLESTQRYIRAITNKNGNSDLQLFIKKAGNPEFGGGTWIHEKLILSLARWLDVEFEIWCDEQIAILLQKNQQVAILPSYQIDDPIKRAEVWIAEQKQMQALQAEADLLRPKALYADAVLSSTTELTTTVIAQELGMSAIRLNKELHMAGVQYKQRGTWVLYSVHVDKGYAHLKTHPYINSEGVAKTKHYLVWTETGREFIHKMLNRKLILMTSLTAARLGTAHA